MKYLNLISILNFVPIAIFAGNTYTNNHNFIQLYNDSIIIGDNIEIKESFIHGNRVIVDSETFRFEDVKFLQIDSNYYANIMRISGVSGGFARRISEGNLNLYEKKATSFSYQPGFMDGPPQMHFTSVTVGFYNSGMNDLKAIDYKNLRQDISADPRCRAKLDRFRNISVTQGGFCVVGSGFLIGGLIKAIKTEPDVDDGNDFFLTGPGSVGIYTGFTFIAISGILHLVKSGLLGDAIDIYNNY